MSHNRSAADKAKLKKLYIEKRRYPGVGYNEEKDLYRRYYKGKESKYLKKLANRRVRRSQNEIQNGSAYKKLLDYWWILY